MKTVVIVEDNPDNRMLAGILLGSLYKLVEYETGEAALKGMHEAPAPDLVLLDISLPGIDGMEVLRQIRQSGHLKATPVVALTAHAATRDRDRFITAGFDDYVVKPIVDEEDLLDTIGRNIL